MSNNKFRCRQLPGALEPPSARRGAHGNCGSSPGRNWREVWRGVLLLLLAVLGAPAYGSASDTWVHVDTGTATVSVMREGRVLESFSGIAIGRAGASHERRRDDRRTPLGEFRIVKIKEPSSFHRFFIIDYPNEARASLALERGEIDDATFQEIRSAVRAGRLPPQDTPLGGNLGIHGLGRGDLRIHETFNWTQGCVALTNEQIDQLTQWIRVGTRVVID